MAVYEKSQYHSVLLGASESITITFHISPRFITLFFFIFFLFSLYTYVFNINLFLIQTKHQGIITPGRPVPPVPSSPRHSAHPQPHTDTYLCTCRLGAANSAPGQGDRAAVCTHVSAPQHHNPKLTPRLEWRLHMVGARCGAGDRGIGRGNADAAQTDICMRVMAGWNAVAGCGVLHRRFGCAQEAEVESHCALCLGYLYMRYVRCEM
jgi:hypothetical protein